jgi:two-component system CheB/CheR fusion protein
MFFFEKKNQKTFGPLRVCVTPAGITSKKSKFFLLLFCSQKRRLFLPSSKYIIFLIIPSPYISNPCSTYGTVRVNKLARPSRRKVNMAEGDPSAATPQYRDAPASAPAGLGFCVVGVGASAGALAAFRRFLGALPAAPGMAFILVQHLDPTHDSMMAELLTGATAMQVVQAEDGMAVQADHVYLIPPGLYLAIAHGRLSLTVPLARHGTRLPFDFLLQSLAIAAAGSAACVILSGGGADGAIGAQAIKAAGGLVIAQDPAEASHPGMPESVIATGVVDFILPADGMAAALQHFAAGFTTQPAAPGTADIIALLKSLTPHDFSLYKTGTMDRRIARRMSMAGFSAGATSQYIARLRTDETERRDLVNDLLINVTSFFRDPKIFELLAATIIPELVAGAEGAIRLWVAGCSTGEETYSLAMLLLERMEAEKCTAMLQIFATDVDALAVAQAREGLYPVAIERDVTAVRLAKYFIREDQGGYRVAPALRGCVVFAVHDVLADPPFSKLNMVSCRNLLIYLQPEAQEKLIAVFNFALSAGGFLFLGAAETVAAPDRRFEQISKPARLYRKLPDSGRTHLPASTARPEPGRLLPLSLPVKSRPVDIGDICRKLLLEHYAPAAILINARFECLYMLGATDLFLRAASGHATLDLLAQLPASLRGRVREAVRQAASSDSFIRVAGGRITRDATTRLFHLEIHKVPGDEDKFLVCFLPQAKPDQPGQSMSSTGATPGSELEAELALARSDLEQAVRRLETAAEEHNAINEEALSANEEYQSTNEELLTSKEELQSLNEELSALNGQLQETLERSRMTSTDLRNVLYSTEVPTLFLDETLKIRFFTPSATLLFHLMPADVGRKLEDFRSLAADPALLTDAATVLATGAPWECEIHMPTGTWYLRRIQAYRTYEGKIAGVVITFNDITERKAAVAAVEVAREEADRANLAKSRFLAAASHDLRQPLQSMSLIAGMLGKTATDAASQKLVGRLDHMMLAITTMLNAMLDINQIEAGIVQPEIVSTNVNELLTRLQEKFTDQAAAQKTELRVIKCGLTIATDPALLEQMLTNLIGNALKYTKAGRVLVGCRRHGERLNIEVWDSGIGIAADQLQTIFDEYHQIDNIARERSRGLGLGLSIVQRLGTLLGHKVGVRSMPGRGSGFSVEVPCAPAPPAVIEAAPDTTLAAMPQNTMILVIEDGSDIAELLQSFLTDEGFIVGVASDGRAAKALVASGAITPDLILADYNLPGPQTGLDVARDLRVTLARHLPVIIMTGDISTATLRLIADADCAQLNKPMKLAALMATIESMITVARPEPDISLASRLAPGQHKTIFVVDDDADIRDTMRVIFERAGKQVIDFPDAESFLAALLGSFDDCCLLVDAGLPGMSGVQLLQKLAAAHVALPSIMVTGHGDIAVAVQAMKAGAADFLEKPVNANELLASVRRVLDENLSQHANEARQRDAAELIAGLTSRQREVMDRVLAGEPSKNIAADLGISQRTVENHRAAIMEKTGAKSIPALARLAVMAMIQK